MIRDRKAKLKKEKLVKVVKHSKATMKIKYKSKRHLTKKLCKFSIMTQIICCKVSRQISVESAQN